jgi:hypothetical protein
MSNKPITPNLQPVSLEQLACGVRTRLKAMLEADAGKVDIAMAIGDLANEAADIVGHGQYGKWIKAAGLTLRTAFDYRYLASNRARVDAFRQRAADLKKSFSIRSVLKELCPSTKPKRPKKLVEIETPQVLGRFLEDHPDLFWESLQLAPKLRAGIAERSPTASAAESAKPSSATKSAQTAAEGRAILELLKHPTPANIVTASEKAARVVRLSDPAKPVLIAPKPPIQLDLGAFNKALRLDPTDLDIPDFLIRTPAAVH